MASQRRAGRASLQAHRGSGAAGISLRYRAGPQAAFISAISAPTALDFSRSSPAVWSGTYSPLNAMRYWVMSHPSPGRPLRTPSAFSTNGSGPIRRRVMNVCQSRSAGSPAWMSPGWLCGPRPS
jgi:hypothetical protein